MRKLLTLLLILGMLPAFAQTGTINPCATDQATARRAAANPQYALELQQMHDAMVQYAQQSHSLPRANRTVSVVVHVLYNTGTPAQNVPTSYINNMIATMNQDYTLTNADTSAVRAAFKSVRGNASLTFCLDTIIRKSITKTCFDEDTEGDAMKSSTTGGDNSYDPTHYLNIWVVALCGSSINGGTGGYTYLPTTGMAGSSLDGVVLDYRLAFRNLMLGLSDPDRVATHEVGHYFNLGHTWGSGAIGATCGDDGFSDTPITKGANSVCAVSTACTASPGSQYENFMDYSSCPHLFTIQQATEMNRVLTSVRTTLLSSPGCSNAAIAPVADFSADKTTTCVGSTVTFTDGSYGNPTSWLWTFTGGTPATSTAQNPAVVYNTAGTYTVTLKATNATGNNTATKTAYITVVAAGALPLTQDFQSTTFPPAGWSIQNPDGGATFTRVTTAGGYGASTASTKITNFNSTAIGDQDLLLFPPLNFTGVTTAKLKYDYAYAPKSTSTYDSLITVVSVDCGENFYLLKAFGGLGMKTVTATATTTAFTPTASQWKSDTIDLSILANYPNAIIGFLAENGGGNNIYIDNVNVFAGAATIPVANFSGTPTTVLVGNTVNFTDLSTNAPTSWSWAFPGAATLTSTVQNPTNIRYNTVGTYTVSLSATNSAGSNTATKTAYINVVASLPGGCDTLTNINSTTSLYVIPLGPDSGYVVGNNVYGDLAKAEKFTNSLANATVTGAFMYFGKAKFASTASTITAKVWNANGTAGAPLTELATKTVNINTLSTTGITYIPFTTPATLTGDFYVGIQFVNALGDTVALASTYDTTVNTAWEKWSDGTWHDFNSAWGFNSNLAILPVVCTASSGTAAPVAAFTGSPTSVCVGGSVAFTDQSTNTPTSWSWTFAGGTPATSTVKNPTVVYNTAGTYTVTLTATNAGGSNTKTTTSYITVKAPPTVTTTVTSNVLCNGGSTGSIAASVTGGTSPYTYRWNTNATTTSLSNVPAGNYAVTVTDAGGCTASSTKDITEPSAITVTATSTNATCGQSNGTATVSATGGTASYTYKWSNNATSSSINGLAAGAYTVTVTDGNSCVKTASVTVTASGALSLTLTPTATTCGRTNGAVSATVSGGATPYTYAWSNGVSASSISNVASGSYAITVRDAGGCSATATTNVATSTAISVTASATQSTCSQVTGTATATATGGSGYTYAWSNGQTTATATGLAAGNYTVTVTATGGCTATATASVSNVGGPTVSVASTTNVLCYNGTGGSINLTVSGGNGTYSYSWSNGRTTQNITGLAAGTYNVTVTSNGCISTANATITQPAQLTANATPQAVACYGGSTGTATVSVTGGTPSYSYLWSNGNTTVTATNLSASNYTVTITDQNSCSTTTSVSISQPTQLTITVNANNTACTTNNGGATANIFGGTTPYTYAWSNGNNTNTLSGVGAGPYTVTATDARGCTVSQSVNIATQNGPGITLSSTPVGCAGVNDGTASVNVTTGTAPYTYRWSNNGTAASINSLSTGTYTVTVTDAGGCSASGNIAVGSTGFTITETLTNITTCQGSGTGSIVLNVTNGSGNYTYLWSNGGTTNTIANLPAGPYSVTVTDPTGGNCRRVETYTITEPTGLSDSIVTTLTTQGGATGSATASSVGGGTAPYTYLWSTGATTATITGLAAGNYSVTVTDANNCTKVTSFAISSSVGVATVGHDFKFDVYPNPNDGRFQVSLVFGEQTNCTIQVYNSVGSLVYSVEKNNLLEDNFSIDLSSYASATYFVRLTSNDHNLVKKVIVFK